MTRVSDSVWIHNNYFAEFVGESMDKLALSLSCHRPAAFIFIDDGNDWRCVICKEVISY